jgi:regulator of sigma E protease
MVHFFIAILSFISTILIVVSVHEFGHFSLAKLFKIKVLRFSIGFGRVLWCWQDKQQTEYTISAIPGGGYVKLLDSREAEVTPADQPYAFDQRPIYQCFAVMIAGVLFNLIFAFFAFWLVLSVGITYVKPLIGEVAPNSPAAIAGIEAGEEIVAIDNHPTPHWAAIAMGLIAHYGEQDSVTITVQEFKQAQIKQHLINIDLRNWRLNALKPDPLSSLGIIPARVPQQAQYLNKLKYPIFPAAIAAWQQTTSFLHFNFVVLQKILTGVISWKSLGGPITIFKSTILAANQGIVIYINFLALLSISIGMVNLFPIPGLDGAQIIYLLVEAVRGKPVSIAMQVLLFRLGVILIALLMMQAMLNDLLRLF